MAAIPLKMVASYIAKPYIAAMLTTGIGLTFKAVQEQLKQPIRVPPEYNGQQTEYDQDIVNRLQDVALLESLIKAFILKMDPEGPIRKTDYTTSQPPVNDQTPAEMAAVSINHVHSRDDQEKAAIFFEQTYQLMALVVYMHEQYNGAVTEQARNTKAYVSLASTAFETAVMVNAVFLDLMQQLRHAQPGSPLFRLRQNLNITINDELRMMVAKRLTGIPKTCGFRLKLPESGKFLSGKPTTWLGSVRIIIPNPAEILKPSEGSPQLHFTVIGEKEEEELRFGMIVYVDLRIGGVKHWLRRSDRESKARARWCSDVVVVSVKLRIMPADERFVPERAHLGRALINKDRIRLRDESMSDNPVHLSRKHAGDYQWQVGFGESDDDVWTIVVDE